MSYTSKAEMIDRYGSDELERLTDRDRSAEAIVDAVLDQALADADALVDGYLAGRYQLPLASVPAILKFVAAEVAWYHLHPTADEETKARYRDALKTLDSISKGTITLDVAGTQPAATGGGGVRISAPQRVFTGESLKGF